MKEIKTPFQVLSTKDEKEQMKDLCHQKKERGQTNAELIIKALESYEGEE